MDEVAAIRDIKHWPLWPWLPIKRRYDGTLQTGTVYADDVGDNANIRVLELNVFNASVKLALYLTNGGDPEEIGIKIIHTYTDVDALVDDGWKGD